MEQAYKATVPSEDIGAQAASALHAPEQDAGVRLLGIAAVSMQLLPYTIAPITPPRQSAHRPTPTHRPTSAHIPFPHVEGDLAGLVLTVPVRICNDSISLHDAVASAISAHAISAHPGSSLDAMVGSAAAGLGLRPAASECGRAANVGGRGMY